MVSARSFKNYKTYLILDCFNPHSNTFWLRRYISFLLPTVLDNCYRERSYFIQTGGGGGGLYRFEGGAFQQ